MQYDMVFEGGGAKGMVFVGALEEVEALGHTPGRLLGTSAGAIMATFLAAGYDSQEMMEALCEAQQDGQPVFLGFLETPPQLTGDEVRNSAIRELLRSINLKLVPDFLEDRLDDQLADLIADSPLTGRLCSFLELGGFFAADNFLHWLERRLNSGLYRLERGNFGKDKRRAFGAMNLSEFHQATGAELSLIASDTTAARMLVLNHHTAPDCPLKWAVRMSMSVPLLWQEVVWQPAWGNYMAQDMSGHTIVDGGLLSNFPIELFLSDQERITKVMGEKNQIASAVLGFLIDELVDVPDAPPPENPLGFFHFDHLKAFQRVTNLVNTLTQAHDNVAIETYKNFVIRLPAGGYRTVDFGMSEKRREALINAGRRATQDYFRRVPTRDVEVFGVEEPQSAEITDRIATRILYS